MTGPAILVVGSANMDLVVSADRLPKPGETLLAKSFHTFPGGKGANQAVAAARAGGRVAMIGRVGTDAFGAQLLDGLRADGVAIDHVNSVEGESGVALIATAASGENTILVVAGANDHVDAAAVDAGMAANPSVRFLLMQLETPLEGVVRAAERAREAGAVVILDPAPARSLPASLLRLVDWITPNETEAALLLGLGDEALDAEDAARRLQAAGVRNVLITLSGAGALLLTEDGAITRLAARKVQAIDTTAAGDTFNGAFAVGLSEGLTPIEAARFAGVAAAISVTRPGAQPSMPSRAEIDAARAEG